MAYLFERDFSTIQDGIRRLAVELINDAIACADGKGRDVHGTVHSLRKSCKKLRGLIRLVRPVFDDYQAETLPSVMPLEISLFRAMRGLIETYDGLLESYKDQVDRPKFAPIRRRLTLVQKELARRDDISDGLSSFARRCPRHAIVHTGGEL